MIRVLSLLNLSQTYPNVVIGLHIYQCMMAPGERSFLKLGIIKGELRPSMRQEKLSILALKSIEYEALCIEYEALYNELEALCSLDHTDKIEEFALAKAQKTAIYEGRLKSL